jgi:hypothetical protein
MRRAAVQLPPQRPVEHIRLPGAELRGFELN